MSYGTKWNNFPDGRSVFTMKTGKSSYEVSIVSHFCQANEWTTLTIIIIEWS